MPTVQKMIDQLAAWGLLWQADELKDAGIAYDEALRIVIVAHTHNAYHNVLAVQKKTSV